jgi:hypothetical protein
MDPAKWCRSNRIRIHNTTLKLNTHFLNFMNILPFLWSPCTVSMWAKRTNLDDVGSSLILAQFYTYRLNVLLQLKTNKNKNYVVLNMWYTIAYLSLKAPNTWSEAFYACEIHDVLKRRLTLNLKNCAYLSIRWAEERCRRCENSRWRSQRGRRFPAARPARGRRGQRLYTVPLLLRCNNIIHLKGPVHEIEFKYKDKNK